MGNYMTPWELHCAWCGFYCLVFGRGMHGADMGSGVEAAEYMQRHVAEQHHRTWREFLRAEAENPAVQSEKGRQ